MDGNTLDLLQGALLGEAADRAPFGIVVSGDDGRMVAVNRTLCELLGYSRSEFLELTAADVTARPPDELAERLERIGRDGVLADTARLRRKDGSVVELGYSGSATTIAGMPLLISITDHVATARG